MIMTDTPIQISGFKVEPIYNLAKDVANGHCGEFVYCLQNGAFYQYLDGYWQEILELKFLSKIEEGLIKIVKLKNKNDEVYEKQVKILTRYPPSRKRQIIDHFKLIKYKELCEFNVFPLLNLNNYMFNPMDFNVCKHSKDYYSTIRVPYAYDKPADCPLWKKTLNEIFEGDINKLNVLQEFFGYGLTRDTKREKALLLLGESRSGKSTILNTFQYMIGEENCSHVALANMDNPVYTSMMINKLINIDGEVSKKAEAFESQFKTIVTGHEVMCNDKFMKPFKFRPFCKFVMSANEFPKITDHSSAFYKRLILIPCNRVFDENEQNINLREELLKELPGILNWAIEGLERLNKNNGFTPADFMKDAVKELENDNNPANMFLNEHVIVAENDYIEKGQLYDHYKKWAEDNKMYPLSSPIFAKSVYKMFSSHTPKDTSHPETRKRIWRNIQYVQTKNIPVKTQITWQD